MGFMEEKSAPHMYAKKMLQTLGTRRCKADFFELGRIFCLYGLTTQKDCWIFPKSILNLTLHIILRFQIPSLGEGKLF